MKIAIVACLLVLFSVAAYGDALFPAALTLDTGYAIGPAPPFPWIMAFALGAPLIMAGNVSAVGQPFQDLLPLGNYEITYVFEGSTCVTVGNFDAQPCSGGEFADFYGGTFALYLDTTPDANFANLSTFRDGDVVLLAQASYIYIADDDPYEVCPMREDVPDISSFFKIVGGLWFERVSNHGVGFDGVCRSEMETSVPAELQALGYVFSADGVVDIDGPVSVTPTTWGRVKALYR